MMSAAVAGTVSDRIRPTRSYTNPRDVTSSRQHVVLLGVSPRVCEGELVDWFMTPG
jgi:hypothetical protein